jgi:hypothetical protein
MNQSPGKQVAARLYLHRSALDGAEDGGRILGRGYWGQTKGQTTLSALTTRRLFWGIVLDPGLYPL